MDIISSIIIALLPVVGLGCTYLYKILAQKLPASTMAMLEQIAPYAVHSVEQTFVNAPSAQKEQLAREFIIRSIKDMGGTPPSNALINGAIKSCVLVMNNMPQIAAAKEAAKAQQNPLETPKS